MAGLAVAWRTAHGMATRAPLADAFDVPKLRRSLTQRWAERLAPWLVVPDDVAPDERTRLLAARLLADGGDVAGEPDFALATARSWSRYGQGAYCEPLEIVRDSADVARAS